MTAYSLLLTLLVVLWAALSGHYSTELLIAGLAVVSLTLVMWLVRRMDREAGRSWLPPGAWGMMLRLPRYVLWLAWQIVTANLHVARLVLEGGRTLAPRVLRVRANQRTELAQVIYANSITLTPGTVTLDLEDGVLLVHGLDEASASSVATGLMDRKVSQLEGGGGAAPKGSEGG